MIKPDETDLELWNAEDDGSLRQLEEYIDGRLRANRGVFSVDMSGKLNVGKGVQFDRRVWLRIMPLYAAAGWTVFTEPHHDSIGVISIMHSSLVMPDERQFLDPQPPA